MSLPRLEKPAWPAGAVALRVAGDPARRFKAALIPDPDKPECSLAEAVQPATPGEPWPERFVPSEGEPTVTHEVRDLWDELVLTLQAGRRLSSAHWRLCLRLNEAAFAQTTLELSCAAGELSVLFRTASETVHARLLTQMPELNQRLQRHAGADGAALMLVAAEELEA